MIDDGLAKLNALAANIDFARPLDQRPDVGALEQPAGDPHHRVVGAETGIGGVRKRLKSKKVKFREQVIPRTGGQQIFLYDPDGVGVELNFPPP